ncbi:hypothetical protein [Aureitalea marina]|uniref:hypothetical protein n=1 Tax=Aureitalea marina TaxID=930804 RepID=UPI0011B024B3|nr:hypothetical protein [Aureitalea marina]
MKHLKRIFIAVFSIVILLVFNNCSNTRYGTKAGVNVTWGPHGPKVRPHIDFDIYNGGRL